MLTVSSGALVPNDTIVNPINTLGTLKLAASLEAPATKLRVRFVTLDEQNNSLDWDSLFVSNARKLINLNTV
ncbi:hypothetical protein PPEP_a3805 [Pseudoalteromonas peptidolytica F12-50-A1]|uniref:Uncharacterized protein n=1 Tax=Pseudoalteromonas peptidolytica F12-50-A1 TaxID=1315280 RepID=A0A8I0MVG8_9GAMM|nr:hypothetical protein [Pseudoalteromonas peptidolytica F12-50-A1]GEK10115.1 hypothetical protein PPE03_23640 [Pseudoalteromonas peptidolytica]